MTSHALGTSEHQQSLKALGLGALGVVFGDIGTSPLYTMKTVLAAAGGKPEAEVVLGSLSLIFWTLMIVTTFKYVSVAMRIDNDGEGGILALMSLLGVRRRPRAAIVAAGLFGAALIYGDGAITPAISVLSALEGLEVATPRFKPYILSLTIAVLSGLFLIQPQGTARIGRAFGPVMLLWFAVIALLGLKGIAQYPSVLWAISPHYALAYLFSHGITGFLVLGAVFLCVTGAEALYADMGHFGAHPIRRAWLWIVFPSLVLCYAGQAAFVLDQGMTEENIFYRLCPPVMLVPLVVLATVATIIASQAIITGAFSMTRQAIRLGWMPRLHITQTSEEGYGQIYVSAVNWLLMIVTIGLALVFQKSDNLASAYGIAVSMTMLMTTILLYIAMREIWQWSLPKAAVVAGAFFIVDTAYFTANSVKIAEGGYVPLILAALVYGVMYIWHRGVEIIRSLANKTNTPVDTFLASLITKGVPRVPGTAVFLTQSISGTPPIVSWYVDHVHALQQRVLAVTVETLTKPIADEEERISLSEIAPDFWRVTARYGFMERPDIEKLLPALAGQGCPLVVGDATFFVGADIVVPREGSSELAHGFTRIFSALLRSATPISEAFNFPRERVVVLGRRVGI